MTKSWKNVKKITKTSKEMIQEVQHTYKKSSRKRKETIKGRQLSRNFKKISHSCKTSVSKMKNPMNS